MKLLEGLVVVDFSQFLSGPSSSLRLSDFGAEVIKIERPETGDICRQLYVSDLKFEGESTIFHAINRNKMSFVADLKKHVDVEKIKIILLHADVLIHNFRPGVMDKLGLSYETVKELNPGIIYAEISGYGNEGPWSNQPGQDLLVQAVSGLTQLSGNLEDEPTPMGVAVADIYSGSHLTQGILAALYRKNNTGVGARVSVSMLESILDFQFEVLTSFYNDGNHNPQRSAVNNAHAFIGAPYGIYQTRDSFIALAMGSVTVLGGLLGIDELSKYSDPSEWYVKRDEIKLILKNHLSTQSTQYWLDLLEPADFWCAEVMNYDGLIEEEGYKSLKMEQQIETSSGLKMTTTRCPIRVDGEILLSLRGAPTLGEHNKQIEDRFRIK